VEIVFPRRSRAERAARRGALESNDHLFWLTATIAQFGGRRTHCALQLAG
jgi:hypothetical protein